MSTNKVASKTQNLCHAVVTPEGNKMVSTLSYMASFKKTVNLNTIFTTWTQRGGNKRPKQQVVPADSPDVETPIIKNQPPKKDTEETEV
jgi:hypothetical protein